MGGRPYNGFSPAERSLALPAIRQAMAAGIIKPSYRCSVCERTFGRPVGQHSEDYRTPLAFYPICRKCHYAVHMRFWRSDYWDGYIALLSPHGWFRQLRLDKGTLYRPFDQSYPDGLPQVTQE